MKIDHMVDTNSERPRADLIALASNHADIRDALGLHAFPPNLDGVRRHFGEAWRCGSGAEKTDHGPIGPSHCPSRDFDLVYRCRPLGRNSWFPRRLIWGVTDQTASSPEPSRCRVHVECGTSDLSSRLRSQGGSKVSVKLVSGTHPPWRGGIAVGLVSLLVTLVAWATPGAASAAPAAASAASGSASTRATIDLSSNWRFNLADVPGAGNPGFDDRRWQRVDLPHTWNALDAQDGPKVPFTPDYFRGVGWYRKAVTVPRDLRNRQLFLEFGGASSVAELYVNGTLVGSHQGAFTRFRVDVTEALGDRGTIAVKVDNSARPDVAPLTGDFPIFGGLYRGVSLIATQATHLDLLDAGSPGVRIRQQYLSDAAATVAVTSRVINPDRAQVVTRIANARGDVVARATSPAGSTVVQMLNVANPHRWHGTDDPYLYSVRVSVVVRGKVVDQVTQPLGLRTIAIDAAGGLLLNGRHYKIHGVNRHQDRLNEGWATTDAQVDRDVRLMREMGVNALRTAHYPQAELVYELADKYGILVYTEVPFVGITAIRAGSNASPELTANLVSQSREMVRSLGNHPSIAWWGIGNEQSDLPDVHQNLQAIADTIKAEDPTRLTVYAAEAGTTDTNLTTPLLNHADLSAYNEYSGWYYNTPSAFGTRMDALHAAEPGRRVGITEYGAGASIYQHTEWPGTPAGSAQIPVEHPEEYQAYYHQQLWSQIEARDYLWGTFVWNMFDFASDFRNEGDRPGRNDKGLVTYDREVRKDAFYYYKSAWTDTPTVHIVSKRWTQRTQAQTTIRVFSNAASVTLRLNGVRYTAPVQNYTAEFPVTLRPGSNTVVAVANAGTHDRVTDVAYWTLRPAS